MWYLGDRVYVFGSCVFGSVHSRLLPGNNYWVLTDNGQKLLVHEDCLYRE